jgi:yeast amino acid transporter
MSSTTEKKNDAHSDVYNSTDSNFSLPVESTIDNEASGFSAWEDFKDSFRRADVASIDEGLTAQQKIATKTAQTPFRRALKDRHLQMIAIGGAIGTGLFVGSGTSLRTGGPLGMLIAYFISSSFILCMNFALGELAVEFPVSGGFNTYITRFVDESVGFAVNFNYIMLWAIGLPLEIVAASITVDYWDTPKKYRDGFVALFWVVIVGINLFGVKGYGEGEFIFCAIKIACILGFIICGICLVCGARGSYIGGKYWEKKYGGPFHGDTSGAKFKAVMSVFISAAFAFSGAELVGLAAAETDNPRKSLPKACKQVFWRIALFYIVSLTLVGLLVSQNDPRLIGSSGADAAASPFVIALVSHGIKGLPSVVNVVICVAVLSVGNSCVYAASRGMCAFAQQGSSPKWMNLDYVDKRGRPLVSIIIVSIFGLISFVAASNKEVDVFNWLYAFCGLSALFTWGCICLAHTRFRMALKVQGRDTSELTFVSPVGVIGSYYGFIVIVFVFIVQFWIAAWPQGYKEMSPTDIAQNFFETYLSFPVVFAFYIGHKIYTKNWKLLIPAEDIDLNTGRRETDFEQLKADIALEKAEFKEKPIWSKLYIIFC